MPKTTPLVELDVLVTPALGVSGGVVHGKPPKEEFGAATLGTLPKVGVGLLMTTLEAFCAWADGHTLDDDELDVVGLES